jgi:hypothetical protein
VNALPVPGHHRARLAALFATASLVVVALAGPASMSAAAGTSLAFATQPGNGQAGVALTQQPVVKVVDGVGQTDTTSTAMVTIAIGYNPSGGTLNCTSGLTVAAVAGIATFSGCSVNNAGDGYTLLATASGLSAVTSSSFNVTTGAPPSTDHLAWGVATANPPPLSGIAGSSLGFTFNVQVQDASNQVVTTGAAATTSITLAMAPNSVGAVVTCTGGNTVNAVAGVATWQGCSVSPAGTGLAFVATAPGFTAATSPTFNILAGGAAPTLTITASRSVILWGEGVDLTVHLAAPSGSAASVAGKTIHIQVAKVHTALGFSTINPGGDVVTDATGTATITGYTPATNLWYQAVFDGDASLGPVTSADTRVVVRQLAAVKPDNSGLVKTITKGTTIEFRTIARPSRDDIPRTHVTWQVWRLVNNHWTLFLTQVSDPDVTGTSFLSITFNTGSWRIRSQANPTQLNANSVWTPFVQFLVK